MYSNTKQIEVGGKKYVLTTRRSILFRLQQIVPELLKINQKSNANSNNDEIDELQYEAGIKIYDHIDVLFYEMIKIAQPNITKEKSDEIYDAFCNEYNDVDENLLNFLQSSFTDGIPREQKKNLNW